MKKGKGKELILLICVIVACILVGISIANQNEGTWGSYSIYNKSKSGYSGFYKVLQQLELNVSRGYMPIEEVSQETCQIIFERKGMANQEALEEWVEAGGTLVYIQESEGETWVTHMGDGIWIQVECAEALTNEGLIQDTEAAYKVYQYLANYGNNKEIVFNEYYLNGSQEAPNLWEVTPLFLKMAIVELILCLILYFYHAGKRFGKVRNLAEEIERTENEYLYAVASLYRKANAWDLVLKRYYREVEMRLSLLTRREEDLIEAWEKEKLPDLEMARLVYDYMNKQDVVTKKNKKQVKQMLGRMEHLLKIVAQRREAYWKL